MKNAMLIIIAVGSIATILAFQNCAKNPNLGDYSGAANSSSQASTTPTTTGTPTNTTTSTTNPSVQAPNISNTQANISVTVGQPISVTMTVTGTTPTYQWLKNSNAIANQTLTLSIPAAALTDSATYTFEATNSSGTSTESFTVTVTAPTTITVTPPTVSITTALINGHYNENTDICIVAGDTVAPYNQVTFTSTATGTNIAYQWYKVAPTTGVATAIAGATSPTYTFTCDTDIQGGLYKVVVTNSAGSASAQATFSEADVMPGGNK